MINAAKTTTTSPLVLFPLNKDGSYKLPKSFKIFVDNFNRFSLSEQNAEEFLAPTKKQFYFEEIPTQFSARIKYNYPTEESLRALTGKNIIFNDVPQGNRDLVLGKLRDYWETLTPETKESFSKITFTNKIPLLKADAISRFYPFNDIIFEVEDYEFNLEQFRHEVAHQHHYMIKDIQSLSGVLTYPFSFNEFDNKWRHVAGDVYYPNSYIDYYTGKDILPEELVKKGLLTPYSATNSLEDVGVFVGGATANPSFFKDLINPSAQNYNQIYRQKLDLLHEYKFISDEEYYKVLDVAGVK